MEPDIVARAKEHRNELAHRLANIERQIGLLAGEAERLAGEIRGWDDFLLRADMLSESHDDADDLLAPDDGMPLQLPPPRKRFVPVRTIAGRVVEAMLGMQNGPFKLGRIQEWMVNHGSGRDGEHFRIQISNAMRRRPDLFVRYPDGSYDIADGGEILFVE